jgi:two-component system NtrC family sensor kinase
LLDYSLIKTPQLENTSIYSVLEECIGFEKEKYASKNIGFLTRLDAISDIHLQIDPLQIRQVFSNIIDNACQAIEKEKGVLEVSATLDEGKQNVIISFKDNGIGIEKKDIARLFEPFFTRKSKGTGLGLTICNELIKLHNGKITIESVPGEGTSVLVALPGEGLKRNE